MASGTKKSLVNSRQENRSKTTRNRILSMVIEQEEDLEPQIKITDSLDLDGSLERHLEKISSLSRLLHLRN